MISKMMLKSSTNLKINHIVNIAYSDIRIENTTPIQEPVVIEEDGKMSDYELLREQNIKEFNKLKKESGLFD